MTRAISRSCWALLPFLLCACVTSTGGKLAWRKEVKETYDGNGWVTSRTTTEGPDKDGICGVIGIIGGFVTGSPWPVVAGILNDATENAAIATGNLIKAPTTVIDNLTTQTKG